MADDSEWSPHGPSHTGRNRIEQIMGSSSSSSDDSGSDDSSSSSSSSSSSKKKKKEKVEPDTSKSYEEAVVELPEFIYGMPNPYSVSRVGLEVYETDEDNYEPYVPKGSISNEGTTTVEDESIDSDNEEEMTPGFSLHMGEVLSTDYITELESVSFESDYKDMNDSGTVKLDNVDLKKAYKGVRVKLLSEWDGYEDKYFKWDYLMPALQGFITEQTFSDNSVEVKISGMTKNLDKKYNFDFQQMYRSEIINQVILTAGLKPFINTEGLEDDITDFKNYSESGGSSDSSTTGGEGEAIDSLVKKIVGSETDSLKKAKLVHGWLQENVQYSGYECTHYSTPEECLNNKGHLNCADTARLTRAMMSSAGLKAYVVHRSHANGHFWTLIKIDGKIYASDQTGSGSPFNTIWYSEGDRRENDGSGGNYDSENGNEPDC